MLKLHLGCGKRDFGPSWVHIDGTKFPHVSSQDIVHLPYADGTVDLIYSSHVFEYFDREEGLEVLTGWYAKLKSGGTLRLAVPDFEQMAQLYCKKAYPLDAFVGPLFGKMLSNDRVIYHKTCFDFVSLAKLMTDAGFKNVERYDWRKTEHSMFDDHSQAYLPHMDKTNGTLISLNVEGVK
jgi:predicted SAM-dependent methyltransferase